MDFGCRLDVTTVLKTIEQEGGVDSNSRSAEIAISH